jgi:hypothetical protein
MGSCGVRNLSDSIRLFSEEPDAFVIEPPTPARRIARPEFVLILSPSPTQSNVGALRTTAAELDGVIAQVRKLARDAGYSRTVWLVGPSSRPEGLAGLLVARGFTPATRAPFEAEFTAMALAHAPPPPPPGAEARLVTSLDEFMTAMRIAMEAFGESEEDAAGWLAAAPALWQQQDGVDRLTYMAFVDGKPVGFAFALSGREGLLLGGSGVLASARGRGAYRALVAARWARAVELGKPALVIQAGAMSRPILERCGFERVCSIALFDDPEMGRAAST